MNRVKLNCKYCGRKISKSNMSKHIRSHENGNFEKYKQSQRDNFICKFCGVEYKNKNSVISHEIRCKNNPNRINVYIDGFNNFGRIAWNRGLTDDTDDRVKNWHNSIKESYLSGKNVPHNLGKHLSKEHKDKISESMKKYLSNNPDKVPYLLNHSSNVSYPEQYFIDVFQNENVDLKYHLQVSKYQLDFYNEELKLDIEIDGEQHYLDKNIYKSDRERDNYMKGLGWFVIRIRWSQYCKLSFENKQKIIYRLKQIVNASLA